MAGAGGLGLIFKTLGKNADEAAEAASDLAAKRGNAMRAKSLKSAQKKARKEGIEKSYNRRLNEASQPKVAGKDTNMYFMDGDTEYRRILNPNSKTNGGSKWLYQSREVGGKYQNITGTAFGKANKARTGDAYLSYDDMIMARHAPTSAVDDEVADVARGIAETGPEDSAGINLWQMISDHPVMATGGLLGGGMLLGEFLDED